MLSKLRDVATLREVDMVDAWDDLGDCEGRSHAILQLVVVAGNAGNQLRGVEALKNGIE